MDLSENLGAKSIELCWSADSGIDYHTLRLDRKEKMQFLSSAFNVKATSSGKQKEIHQLMKYNFINIKTI